MTATGATDSTQNDDLFRFVADTSPTLSWISGPGTLRSYFNDAWLAFRGRAIDAEVGHGWATGLSDEDAEHILNTCTRACERREPFKVEYRLRRHDGEYRWMLDSGVPRLASDGSLIGYIGSCVDVTDLKHAETAMRAANDQLHLALASGKCVGWEWDVRSNRDTWFGDLQTMFGLSEQTRVARVDDFRQMVHPDDQEHVWRAVSDARQTRNDYYAEFRIRRPDGIVRWVAAKGKFYYATDGVAERMLGIAVDITEQRHADHTRRRHEIDLLETQRLAGVGTWQRDPHTDTVTWSEELFRIIGLPPTRQARSYRDQASLFTPESWLRLLRADDEALGSGTPYELDLEVIRTDRTRRWLTVRGEAERDASGRIAGLRGTAQDVTDRRLAERALRENEERLRLAAQAGRMFAYTWDVPTDTIVRSGESAAILGIDETAALTGREAVARIHSDDRDAVLAAIGALTPAEPRLHVSYRIIRPDGSLIWVERTSRAYFDDDGNMIRMIGMVADITLRQRAEEALSAVSQRLIEAQEAERARIARDLHDDFGQRLTLLTMALDHHAKALPPSASRKLREGLQQLQTQASEIASDLQALAYQLHSPRLQLLGIVTAMRSFCAELSSQQHVEIQFTYEDVPQHVPPAVALCLFRVLQEALCNAIRHSGVRRFDAHLRGTLDGLWLSVRDSGVGFDPQVARTGRGLGLTSMTERLKLVGGILDIQSKANQGTTLVARVPLEKTM
jgi:PAS domain S-box-containing protein